MTHCIHCQLETHQAVLKREGQVQVDMANQQQQVMCCQDPSAQTATCMHRSLVLVCFFGHSHGRNKDGRRHAPVIKCTGASLLLRLYKDRGARAHVQGVEGKQCLALGGTLGNKRG